MAYDPKLAARIRDLLSDRDGVTEKTMFGGVAFLLSTIRGVRRGRIVGPAIRGVIAVALMGWAVS